MNRQIKTAKRASRQRYKLKQVAEKGMLRLSVFRSGQHIGAQIIDDKEGKTLASASSVDKKLRADVAGKGSSVEGATKVGAEIAKRAKAAGIENVYFDRGGYRYHGRVKALAEAARENGLQF